jgi:copper(I)-binding protein
MFRLIALALFAAATAPPLELVDGRIGDAPPTAPVLAGYGRLHNATAKPLVVRAARSADFERVELHEMTLRDGVMRMRALEQLELAPGATFELEPGRTHLMLIGPKRALKAGDRVTVVFETPEAVELTLVR